MFSLYKKKEKNKNFLLIAFWPGKKDIFFTDQTFYIHKYKTIEAYMIFFIQLAIEVPFEQSICTIHNHITMVKLTE